MQSWELEDLGNVGLMMLFALGGYIPLLMNGLNSAASQLQYENAAGSPLSRAVIGVLFVASMLVVGRAFPQLSRKRMLFLPLLPYFVWAIASVAWSQDPSVSERKLFSFVLTCIYGFYFAIRFPLRRQLSIVLVAASLLAIGSLLLILFSPEHAIDHAQHLGAWQGVFPGKNPCATTMVVGLAAALAFHASSALQRVLKFAMMVLFVGIVSKTDSIGAVIAIAVLALSLPLFKLLARSPRKARALILLTVSLFAIAAVITAVEFLPGILRLLHRDPTLTGRTRLWAQSLQAIFKRPLLGYGYGAFWLGLRGQSANIAFITNWTAPHAHNGFIDVWLSLGGVGLALFAYSLLQATVRIWRLLRAGLLEQGIWMVSLILLIITFNVGESVLISAPSLMWILYVTAVVGLERFAPRMRSEVSSLPSARPVPRSRSVLRPLLIGPPSTR